MEKLSSLKERLTRLKMESSLKKYPQDLSEEQASSLVADIEDWQLTHGSLLKYVKTDDDSVVHAHPVGASVFPTLFPRHLFFEALSLQKFYNKLYTAVAEDEHWLYETLQSLIKADPLTVCLWGIYEEVRSEGYVQDLSLGIWRNDYMLHVEANAEPVLKQVEFNTIAVAGGTHGNKISDMHGYLQKSGAYNLPPEDQSSSIEISASFMPLNTTINTLTSGLIAAHKAYGQPSLEIFNIADERPLEQALWAQSPTIPSYRLEFGPDVLENTSLTSTRELLYHPPSRPGLTLEVSVVYYRSAFETHEYNSAGRMARLHLERSRTIKCPSLLSHLCTFKIVQQALAMPGALERFLEEEEVERVRRTFAPLYVLNTSQSGIEARRLACDPRKAEEYVLKPSLEGGGHNVYGGAIPEFLKGMGEEMWGCYVLMGKIVPPVIQNVLMSQRGIFEGNVISELGVFGVCLWRRKEGGEAEMVQEMEPCWSFKTKDASVDEMSVVKGYGCFDSPLLVERDVFANVCQ